MSELNNFIAKLPTDIANKTRIYPDKIILPMNINCNEFFNTHKVAIKDLTFTTEKAIFVASKHRPNAKFTTFKDLLNMRLRF